MTVASGSIDSVKEALRRELEPPRKLHQAFFPHSDLWYAFPSQDGSPAFKNTDIERLAINGFLQRDGDAFVLKNTA